MSEKTVRIHSHGSNRARKKEVEQRKTVFKTVLDNPFRIEWPSIPLDVQNSILSSTVSMMQGVAEYNQLKAKACKKRKKDLQITSGRKRRKVDDDNIREPRTTLDENPVSSALPDTGLERPRILRHLAVGINEVTKRLEAQIRKSRACVIRAKPEREAERLPLAVVMVCRNDMDPIMLVDHFPYLVASYNSSQETQTLKLVTLPKGAETIIAQAVGLPRAAVIGIDVGSITSLLPSLNAVPTLAASWLSIPKQLVPSHIKQIKTSAPKDMKAEKTRRKEAKARRKRKKAGPTPLQEQKDEIITENAA